VTTTVEVPANYNYYVDAALWSDDVLIDETQGVANLNPRETISANQTTEEVEFAVEDFTREEGGDDAGGDGADAPDRGADGAGDSTPGFGPLVALVALVAAALVTRRRR
jgi:PGF-CTERM protein